MAINLNCKLTLGDSNNLKCCTLHPPPKNWKIFLLSRYLSPIASCCIHLPCWYIICKGVFAIYNSRLDISYITIGAKLNCKTNKTWSGCKVSLNVAVRVIVTRLNISLKQVSITLWSWSHFCCVHNGKLISYP